MGISRIKSKIVDLHSNLKNSDKNL